MASSSTLVRTRSLNTRVSATCEKSEVDAPALSPRPTGSRDSSSFPMYSRPTSGPPRTWGREPDSSSYFLVQLQPEAKAEQVCAAIRQRLPEADAFPRDVYSWISINFWMTRTGIGISFGAATLLGLFVGMIMVAQTLYALVLDRIAEFGTLKAIGASERQIHSILLLQSLALALVGSTIGLAIVSIIQRTLSTPKAPITIPLATCLGKLRPGHGHLPGFFVVAVPESTKSRSLDGTTVMTSPSVIPESAVVHVAEVHKAYRRGSTVTPVLDGVDLTVQRGECVFLAGPSGSGKTTLLSIIGCVLSADRGTVRVLNQDLLALDAEARAQLRLTQIGFVFQRFNLIRGLTAVENVAVPLTLQAWRPRAARQRAMDLLDAVGLAEKAKVDPRQLSAGQCQRVAMARALAADPELILADEPTASLDAANGQKAMQMLRRLTTDEGKTAIVVTHDQRIFPFADRICQLENGRVTETAGPGTARWPVLPTEAETTRFI